MTSAFDRAHRRLAAIGLAFAALVLLPASVLAHPLGNFTINHWSGIRVEPDRVVIDHVIDMAEIPTFSERRAADVDGDGAISSSEAATYASAGCERQAAALELRADGAWMPLSVSARGLTFPMGQGAETLRLVCTLEAPVALAAGGTAFTFADPTFAERIGWREVTVQADRATLTSADAPAAGTSERLTAYPADLLAVPPGQVSAAWSAVPGGPALPPLVVSDASPVGGDVAPTDVQATTAAVPWGVAELGGDVAALFGARELTIPIVLLSVLAAAGLGALHALSPGHGKTVMAAYLVGSRGTVRQAVALGLTVTVSHTLGVLALGLLTLSAASLIPAERLYPILGLVSGAIVIAIGAWLVLGRVRVIRAERAATRAHAALYVASEAQHGHHGPAHHDHGHAHHDHGHAHHDREHGHLDHGHEAGLAHGHDHPHAADGRGHDGRQAADDHGRGDPRDGGWHSHGGLRHTHLPPPGSSLGWRGLFGLGLAGGMVPSVSALILLLGSISAGRPAYGVALTICFGLGMALVLVGVGMALVYARSFVERQSLRPLGAGMLRLLPSATAAVVLVAGVVITTQAALAIR